MRDLCVVRAALKDARANQQLGRYIARELMRDRPNSRAKFRELVKGVAMSTSAVTPFRSFVQTPIFSVSPSSFRLQRI